MPPKTPMERGLAEAPPPRGTVQYGDMGAILECEIHIRGDGRLVWINVDGVCRLRVILGPKATFTLTDDRDK